MEKLIKAGESYIRLKSNGLALLSYKREFGRDLIPDLFTIYPDTEATAKGEKSIDISMLDVEKLINITYVFAKIADKNIGTRDEWLESLDILPIGDIAVEVMPFVVDCITTDAEIKKRMATAGLKRKAAAFGRRKSFWQRFRQA